MPSARSRVTLFPYEDLFFNLQKKKILQMSTSHPKVAFLKSNLNTEKPKANMVGCSKGHYILFSSVGHSHVEMHWFFYAPGDLIVHSTNRVWVQLSHLLQQPQVFPDSEMYSTAPLVWALRSNQISLILCFPLQMGENSVYICKIAKEWKTQLKDISNGLLGTTGQPSC